MIRLLGSRGASAVIAFFMLALGSSEAGAQVASVSPAAALMRPAVASTTAVRLGNGTVVQAQPASSVTLKIASSMATEAAWLYRNGWPLYALVDRYATAAPLDAESNCLATAVYFEARGESVDGQLAVARVVMNRAASGKYPPSWCATVKQPWQFSFVRHGEFPPVDSNCDAWRKAEAIARLAAANVVPSVSTDVLWYHADYVAPSWRNNLTEVRKIGQHIFYRA